MASRYWVGGGSSVNWNATANTNWAATSGGANNASVPGVADDVFFDGNSGTGNSNISATLTVLTLDCTGYLGTITHQAVTLTLTGNLCKLSAGMTYTAVSSSSFLGVNKTSGTMLLTTAGKTLGSLTLQGNGCVVQLQDDLTIGSTGSLTLQSSNAVTFDANNKNVSVGSFASAGTAVRTLNMGTQPWNITKASGTIWNLTATNLTFTASDIVFVGAAVDATKSFIGGGLTYASLTFASSPNGQFTIADNNTFTNLTIGEKSSVLLGAGSTTTVTGTLSADKTTVTSSLFSAPATISKASGAVSLRNTALRALTCQGGATFRAENSIDLGGNTGITIVPPGPSPSFSLGA